jgi:hypothetical protein
LNYPLDSIPAEYHPIITSTEYLTAVTIFGFAMFGRFFTVSWWSAYVRIPRQKAGVLVVLFFGFAFPTRKEIAANPPFGFVGLAVKPMVATDVEATAIFLARWANAKIAVAATILSLWELHYIVAHAAVSPSKWIKVASHVSL